MTLTEIINHAPIHFIEMIDVDSIQSKNDLLNKCDIILTIYHDHLGPKGHLLRNHREQWKKELEEIRSYMEFVKKVTDSRYFKPLNYPF